MRLFERIMEGVGVGGVIGGAIGTIAGGAATVATFATAPISLPIMAETAVTTVGVSALTAETRAAAGTLIGGSLGAVTGTVEDIKAKGGM